MYRKTSIQAQQNFNKRGKILQAVWLYFMLPPLGRTLWIKKKQPTHSSSFERWGSSAGWWDQTSAGTPWRPWRTPSSGCGTWNTQENNFSVKYESDPLLPARLRSRHRVSQFWRLSGWWFGKKKFPHKEIQCVGFMRLLGRVYWQIGDIILAEIKFDILNYVFISV